MRNDRRRDRRRDIRRKDEGETNIKNIIYSAGIILALGIIAFVITVIVCSNNSEKIYDDLGMKEIGEVASVQKDKEQTEEISSNLGKTVEESKEEMKEESKKIVKPSPTPAVTNNKKEEKNTQSETKTNETKKIEEVKKEETKKKELKFVIPVTRRNNKRICKR